MRCRPVRDLPLVRNGERGVWERCVLPENGPYAALSHVIESAASCGGALEAALVRQPNVEARDE